MLVGRKAERRHLDSLLESARAERSSVLVLRGEPGIGKTTLLEYATEQAKDMNVLRCVGLEAEHELPFAGMHQLVRSHLDLIERLPPPQAAALRGALGLTGEVVTDRFLVSLALLSLLAETCAERPTLCCVDDAQWLDAPSAEALTFAARRFEAEPIALLVAVREGELRRFDAPGLPALLLTELDQKDSAALLNSRLSGTASPDVLEMLLTTAAGNPLALVELPAALTGPQLEGTAPILGPPPVRPATEEVFRARVESLSETTKRVLVIAAAADADDLGAIGKAAARLGLDASAELDVAERAGLVRLNAAVSFRHPLVRSVIYRGAARAERKAAHESLAEVVPDAARSAWHRALVADGADESIAAALERAGEQAVARAAHATAAPAFERAAELSEQDASKGRRLQRAAQACVDAGRPDAALALVERARPLTDVPMDHAKLNLVQSMVAGRRGTPRQAYDLVMDAADRMADESPDVAVELTLLTIGAGFQGGWGEQILDEAHDKIQRIPSEGETKRFASLFLEGSQALVDGDPGVARERLDAAMEIADRTRSNALFDFGAGPLLFYSVFICLSTGDLSRAHALLAETLAIDRAHGGIGVIASILPLCAFVEAAAGRLASASAFVAEGLDIADQLDFENDTTALLAIQARVAALQGREDECRRAAETALQRATTNCIGWAATGARVALAQLELGLGNATQVIHQLEELEPGFFPPQTLLATPDFVDAALRAGEPERASDAVERFAAWALLSREPLVPGMLARCRGMLASDADAAKRLFDDALEHHTDTAPAFELARTQLAYGERLRRDRRRVDARAQLRDALTGFESIGARPWVERARGELKATGETARKRDASTLDDLTPQELRIAQLVAAGATNRDVATQLFVSPKTVEYHLHKVFLKVGVKSRVELSGVGLAPGHEPPKRPRAP